MMLRENVVISLRNINANKFKTFLTLLGFIIGVAMIIALSSILAGVTETMRLSVHQLNPNRISLRTTKSDGFSLAEVEIYEQLDNVEAVSPITYVSQATVKVTAVESGKSTNTRLTGRSPVFFERIEGAIVAGSAFSADDVRQQNRVCVIGEDVKDALFFGESCLGAEVMLDGLIYTVCGVADVRDKLVVSLLAETTSIPYTLVTNHTVYLRVMQLDIFIEDLALLNSTAKNIEAIALDMCGSEELFTLVISDDVVDTLNNIIDIMSTAIVCITAISLVIGGIGIMNMMLANIKERTVEIGLRQALGATPLQISQQFLLEALLLSAIGALIGVIIGIIITAVGVAIINCVFIVEVKSVLIAVFFALLTGAVFGLAPARYAGRLKPIEALKIS